MKRFNPASPLFLSIAAIAIYVSLLGFYAVYLNHLYYSKYSPFYDSMSYLNQLAIVMHTSNSQGFLAGIGQAAIGGTVFFPWFEAALLGVFCSPARADAIFIQLPLVFAQSFSAFFYFRLITNYSAKLSLIFSFVLVSYTAIFFYNGGLSDFRMDLSQALSIGSALAFFVIARHTQKLRFWILFSVMLSVSFLVRATTPVYALLIFGPIFLLDLFGGQKSYLKLLKPYLLALAIVIGLTIWFFILNFDYLHYYYFIWNDDANASLPISESVKHLRFLFKNNIGIPFVILGMGVFLFQLFLNFNFKHSTVNWVMLYGGVVPVAFLILFGTAINPYVSMASVPGLLMFFLGPFENSRSKKPLDKVIIFFSILAIAVNILNGYKKHLDINSEWIASGDGISKITTAIQSDMQRSSRKHATFEMTFIGGLDSVAILNSLIYDQGFTVSINNIVAKNNLSLQALQPSGLANHREWLDLPGDKPEDKLTYLVNEANQNANYLILPEDGTKLIQHHAITPYEFQFRDMLINTGNFERVSEPIKISNAETISIYKNKLK
ncbi:hypothetical protein Q9292_06930 [Methylophilus sp. VKM B-3414]|uniref:hypothetical protein n=1 Tax=Methylophilus sp. VKM B-3414 TaxID=3076121 RepID=UPI0028C9496E|nr:hypothetical protein [Methylophilus sp. VKM B-3414]MDT7849340.1 hypothetical protein [Methylophilus sp. VKM B-3414]